MKAEWTNKDSLSIESTGQKAILVLDMPNECDGCPCLNQKLWECQADKKRRSSDERPLWCPLKPIPKKIESGKIEDGTKTNIPIPVEHFAMGWNACLDAITGETE